MNTANHQILYQLSTESNAKIFHDFNTDQIVNTLKESPLNKTILHTSEKVESVINNQNILKIGNMMRMMNLIYLLQQWRKKLNQK